MTNDDYHIQRLEGARLINEEIRKIAKECNIKKIEIEWNKGCQIVDRDFHILKISSQGVIAEAKFPDESLADFPSKVETEPTKMIIKNMLLNLKEKLK